jgi:hypothetical protein
MTMLHRLRCLLGKHSWQPYGLQIWLNTQLRLAAYKNAKCAHCPMEKGKSTVFALKDVPPDQILGKYPYQTTEDGIFWITAGYKQDGQEALRDLFLTG